MFRILQKKTFNWKPLFLVLRLIFLEFFIQAKVLSLLNHPNIICYYDTFEENGVLMIEMEYADDGTLSQFLSKRVSRFAYFRFVVIKTDDSLGWKVNVKFSFTNQSSGLLLLKILESLIFFVLTSSETF